MTVESFKRIIPFEAVGSLEPVRTLETLGY